MSKVYGAIKQYFIDNSDNQKEDFKKLLKGEGKHILFYGMKLMRKKSIPHLLISIVVR